MSKPKGAGHPDNTVSNKDMARVRQATNDRFVAEIRNGNGKDFAQGVGQQVLAGQRGEN